MPSKRSCDDRGSKPRVVRSDVGWSCPSKFLRFASGGCEPRRWMRFSRSGGDSLNGHAVVLAHSAPRPGHERGRLGGGTPAGLASPLDCQFRLGLRERGVGVDEHGEVDLRVETGSYCYTPEAEPPDHGSQISHVMLEVLAGFSGPSPLGLVNGTEQGSDEARSAPQTRSTCPVITVSRRLEVGPSDRRAASLRPTYTTPNGPDGSIGALTTRSPNGPEGRRQRDAHA